MRLSVRHKFIFLSNIKCGSESIRLSLTPFSDILSTHKWPFHHHVPAPRLKTALDAIGWEWDDFYSFTTIRNPWDRVVSAWAYADKEPRSVWNKRKAEAKSFYDFIKSVPADMAIDQFAAGLVNDIVPLEQTDNITAILRRIGIKGTIPHHNRSEHKPYREYYDRKSRQYVASLFASDIEMGEYSF